MPIRGFVLTRPCQNRRSEKTGGRTHALQGSRVSEPIISVSELTRRFGGTTALDSVSLSLPRGAVYGLVGANGAGKTTLIKHLLGLLRAEGGTVRVFGLDPVADPVGVLSRIGYLSEENDLPGWMRVGELVRYSRAFYPGLGRCLRGGAAAERSPWTPRRGSRTSPGGRRRAPDCSSRWPIVPSSSCSTSRRPASIPWCAATSWTPSCAPSPTKAARCSSRRTCWRRWSGSPTTSR